uniref:TRAF-type domain-containing protein n=1 Tax=Macrostomum lignano TaxID=282301 RepID=A0A1I8G627_9PLAT
DVWTTMSELPSSVSVARPVSALPAHLQCSSCSKPLFNARQTPHGCRLCQACVTGLLHEVEKRPCPGHTEACTLRDHHSEEDVGGGGSGGDVETEVSHATCFPDMATRREVAKLRVRCPNCDAGCSVQLEWARIDQHVQQSCDWHSLRCEQCKELILKKDMQRHTSSECRHRKETCDLCSQLVTHSEMETSHRNLQSDVCCPRFSARCPHCSERSTPMDRRGYVAHLSECPERPVECKYSHLGCRAMVRRSDLERHYRESVDSHLELMDSKLKQAAIAQQSPSAAVPQSYVGSAAPAVTTADGLEVADVKRRVGSVFEQFKKLQLKPNVLQSGGADLML